ncbi:MAG TPA: terminase small subunit, partial [Rhodopila sp.]|nr:terminase small subunit [Rhodopila sp.]
MGRPSSFTQEVADAICVRLMDGESLREICAEEEMPDRVTVYRWLQSSEAFRNQYAHARDVQADTYADETKAIADDGS